MEDQTGMQPAAPQAAPAVPVVKQVKELLSQDKIKEKFGEVLGQKAPQFMASITNTVSGSAQLKKCPANSIIGAAFVAATYDLPIDSNLGFAAIVPYNESVWNPRKKDWEKVPKAQFQMMYKGFIEWQQLQHPISHTIIQDGRPKAKAEDKLILGERIFLIQGIDDPGSIGVCTIYYVEERMDVK